MDSDLISRVKWGNIGLAMLVIVMLAVLVGWPALGPAEPALPEDVVPAVAAPRSRPAPTVVTGPRPARAAKPRKGRASRKRRVRRGRSASGVHAPRAPARAPVVVPPLAPEFGFER